MRPTFEQFGRYAWVAVVVALALPVYELVLAVLLLVLDAAWPSYLALATFVVFTIVLVRRVVKNDRIYAAATYGTTGGHRMSTNF